MADRIGIMRSGVVQQVGTPQEVYNRPANSFVAGFLGKVNVSHAAQVAGGRFASTDWADDAGAIAFDAPSCVGELAEGEPFVMAIRPEHIRVSTALAPESHTVKVRNVVYLGSVARVKAAFAKSGELTFDLDCGHAETLPTAGDTLYVSWDNADVLRLKDVG